MPNYGNNRTTRRKRSWDVKETKNGPEINSLERVDLDPAAFDRLLLQKGTDCRIYRTMYCPKVKSVDGAEHEIDCNLCAGTGFIDFDPICARVMIMSQALEKLPKVEGMVDGNTVLMTFPIGIELQYFTRIELENYHDIFFQNVMRNPRANTDVLKYRAVNINGLIDSNGVRYYPGTDFEINTDGNIKWLGVTQQRTLAFSAVPTGGQWEFRYGQTPVGTYGSGLVAATLQADIRTATGIANALVTGSYAAGFVLSFPGTQTLLKPFYAESLGLNAGTPFVTITLTDQAIGGRKPAPNQPYAIHYEACQRFRLTTAVHVNRFTQVAKDSQVEFVKLPEQWYAAKEFFPRRLNKDGTEAAQGPYDNHAIVEED